MSQNAHAEQEFDLVVTERRDEAEDVVALRLARPDGAGMPKWQPGAHIDLMLDCGLIRQYSLTGNAVSGGSSWEIAVLREHDGRGGSRWIFDSLQPASKVRVRGPRNHFALEPAPNYLFVAGGIGITPIRAMVAAAEHAGNPWRLLYGGRRASSMAYVEELVSEYGEKVLVRPEDQFGLLDLAGFVAEAPPGTKLYCCGPEPLLTAAERQCASEAACDLRVERFSARPAEPGVVDRECEVELAQTGATVTVPPGVSILAAAEEAGAFVTSSCEEGTCGSCETAVLSGTPEHRDSVLNAQQRAAGDTMMICVSRCAGGKLVLDL
ncbi:PDR/VanB family oxidoreductase [Mycobacterium sp.]|uniref:PDR/VanB family oxidoreductase n=1 Tax=Mycobacterium sp. TaxID=1785 RepID=UPI003D0F4A94